MHGRLPSDNVTHKRRLSLCFRGGTRLQHTHKQCTLFDCIDAMVAWQYDGVRGGHECTHRGFLMHEHT